MSLSTIFQCRRHRAAYNLVVFLVTSVFVQLGLTKAYGDRNVKEMSYSYFTLITPPGGAFAIFGIIYISELCSLLAQLQSSWSSCRCEATAGGAPVDCSETAPLISSVLPHQKSGSCAATFRCGMHTLISMTAWTIACVFQAVWMISFLRECMILALLSLLIVFLALLLVMASCTTTFYHHEEEDVKEEAQEQATNGKTPETSKGADNSGESVNLVGVSQRVTSRNNVKVTCWDAHSRTVAALQWLLRVGPFSLHCGWMTAAFAVALQNLEVQYCASPTVQLTSVVLSVAFASIVVYEVSIRNVNPAYAAGVSWALLFLTQRRVDVPICVGSGEAMAPASGEVHQTITYVALLGGVGFLLLSLVRCVWPLLETCVTDFIRSKAPELRARQQTTSTVSYEQSVLQWLLTRQ